MHPIGGLLPRLFPALLVLTAAVLIAQLVADEPSPAEDHAGDGEGRNDPERPGTPGSE